MNKQNLKLLFCLLMVLGLSLGVGAVEFGWMQPGVRVWYFGGTGGLTTSNATEAYLIKAVSGTDVQFVRHSALNFWGSPKPVENLTAPVNKGSFWIHPAVLQTLAPGDFWLDQEILTVIWENHTYPTFHAYSLLPAIALFGDQAQRQIVRITYTIPGTYSTGLAYFDAETGLALCRTMIFEGYTVFFILAEINYNFAQQTAFAEDGGPHCGFKSRVAESAFPGGGHAGGIVDIQSGVETRYGNRIEMWVTSSFTGPQGSIPLAFENYYFDGDVPTVLRIDHDEAPNYPPDQWNPFGQYLCWWLPPTVTGAQANAVSGVSLAPQTIDVFDVLMTKTSDQPLTYTATENPQQFYFSTLWLGDGGYLTLFSAKDPTIGLDIDGNSLFANGTTVDGLSYYLNTMGLAIPVVKATKNDFNRDGKEDILWRYYGPEGYNVVWYMASSAGNGFQAVLQNPQGTGLEAGIRRREGRRVQADLQRSAQRETQGLPQSIDMLRGEEPPGVFRDALEAGGLLTRSNWESVEMKIPAGERVLVDPRETAGEGRMQTQAINYLGQDMLPAVTNTNWKIAGTGDFNSDGKTDILWRYYGPEGYNVVWYMNGAAYAGQDMLPAVTNTNWKIVGTGDFNSDGKTDILWRYHGPEGLNVVWYMNEVNYAGQDLIMAVANVYWEIAGTGDFNSDGKTDILWRYHGPEGLNVVWYMNGVNYAGQDLIMAVPNSSWRIENH